MPSSSVLINPGHLTDIGVALDGSLIARGSMEHPVDVQGYFPCPEAELLRISRERGFRIVRCHASREQSGFLSQEEFGSELHVPAPLAALIERALILGAKETLEASLDHQDGTLRSSTSREKVLTQPLSAWKLVLTDADGVICVGLTAHLYGSVIPEWDTSTANFWPGTQDQKLKVEFRIDPVTRVACFGSHVPSLVKEPATPALIPTDTGSSNLNIGNAPVGTFAQFAVSGDRWMSFLEGGNDVMHPGHLDRYLSITEHDPPTRNPLGLLNDSRGYRWPRISMRGVDMRSLAYLLVCSTDLQASVSGDTIGEAYRSFGSDGSESLAIENLSLDFRIDEAGLHIRITGDTTRGQISFDLKLVWELLILRFPYFTRFMKTLGKQEN